MSDNIVRGQVGVDLLLRAERAMLEEGLPSCSLVLLEHGEVLLDAVLGASPDALHHLWSVSKAMASALIGTLLADGTLVLDELASSSLPWFIGEGKEHVTLEHLLTHTAGLASAPLRPIEGRDPGDRQRKMQTWRTTHEPGTAFRYHPSAAHWVIGTIIEAKTGQSVEALWQSMVASKLALDDLTFSPAPDLPRLQPSVAVGEPTPREVVASLAQQGIDLDHLANIAPVEALLAYNDHEVRAVASPGASGVGSARDVARLLDALCTGRDDLWPPDILRALTTDVRVTLPDPDLAVPSRRSLGFGLSGPDPLGAAMRELPTTLGEDAFGSPGACGQIAWADPDSGRVFVFLTNGLARDPLQWFSRVGELNTLAAA